MQPAPHALKVLQSNTQWQLEMTRTKNNPKLSHDQWLLVQKGKEQIKIITKLQDLLQNMLQDVS